MKTSIHAAVEAAKVAASVIELICRSPKFTAPGHHHQYRSPEQIALIVDMVNAAMDAVLSLNVGTVEAITDPLKTFPPCNKCHGKPGKLEISVLHEGDVKTFSTLRDALKFMSETANKSGLELEIKDDHSILGGR